MNNDGKIKNYQKQKLKTGIIIVLSLAVIVLEVLALFNTISMLWGCILFLFIYILKKMF